MSFLSFSVIKKIWGRGKISYASAPCTSGHQVIWSSSGLHFLPDIEKAQLQCFFRKKNILWVPHPLLLHLKKFMSPNCYLIEFFGKVDIATCDITQVYVSTFASIASEIFLHVCQIDVYNIFKLKYTISLKNRINISLLELWIHNFYRIHIFEFYFYFFRPFLTKLIFPPSFHMTRIRALHLLRKKGLYLVEH